MATLDRVKKEFDKGKKWTIERIPMRLGSMTDCFANNEAQVKITRDVVRYLNSINYPYIILTKNKLVADYSGEMNPELCAIQMSITTPYDSVSEVMEPGASKTSERLAAGLKLSREGFYVQARINPLFPIYPDGHYSREATDKAPLQYFSWDLPEMICQGGFKTIIAGFLRLSTWNIRWIKQVTGVDLKYLFEETRMRNGALHFSAPEVKWYYRRIQQICHRNGVRFSVCYDGDENYLTFKEFWANTQDCCDIEGHVSKINSKFDFHSKHFSKRK